MPSVLTHQSRRPGFKKPVSTAPLIVWSVASGLAISGSPPESVSADIKKLITEEVRVLGDDRVGTAFSGFQYIGSPMSRDDFARASDKNVIKAFQEVPDATDWDHPKRSMTGGNIPLSREFAEFAKSDPERAARLIRRIRRVLVNAPLDMLWTQWPTMRTPS